MGGVSDESTTVPWKEQIPYMMEFFKRAQERSDIPLEYYPDSTVAPRQQGNILANQAAVGRAQEGYKTLAAGDESLQDTLSGRYLDPETNPWLTATTQMAQRRFMEPVAQLQANLDAKFVGSGQRTTNRSAMAAADKLNSRITQGLGDISTSIYGQNYQAERGRMMQANSLVPAQANAFSTETMSTRMAGLDDQSYAQQQLNDMVNRFNFDQQEPDQRLDRFGSRVKQTPDGAYGTRTVQQGTGASEVGGLLGGIGSLFALFGGLV